MTNNSFVLRQCNSSRVLKQNVCKYKNMMRKMAYFVLK